MSDRASRIDWTAEQLNWIEANKTMVRREAYAEFCKIFRVDISFDAYKSLCKRKGWKAGRAWLKPGYISPIKDRNWSPDQLSWIEANKALPRREAHAKFCEAFKTSVSFGAYSGLCKRKEWKTGRDGRLQPGGVSWNKGKKMPYNANAAKTQFKKGQLPHNTKFLGHERISKDGYTEISVKEKNPHTGYERRYVLKHRWLWEQKNGKVPKDHVLKCLDGDKQNTDPSNWEAVPLAVNALLNSRWSNLRYGEAPEELKPTIMAVAKLKHKARSKRDKRT